MDDQRNYIEKPATGIANKIIYFCLTNRLIIFLLVGAIAAAGIAFAPFDWQLGFYPRDPVAVDAIPDIGENQQIVFTEWPGRSPQDIQDQVTYPLTVALMGISGVRTIRSNSMFGFSSIYIIFDDDVDFYFSRSRIIEKLNSLSPGILPPGVSPALGPDATALGQVFWYTLEGRDKQGNPTGGWDLQDLRSIQDWTVRYALQSAGGVAEVASVGGFVKEYQIDVDPDAMRAAGVNLKQIFAAVKASNIDVGARTIEINRVEYVIRGIGFIKTLSDIENTVVTVNDNVPILIKDIAQVSLGPALRRGALDKDGAEAVGGVVVVRYGFNPLKAIRNVKEKIMQVQPGLPQKTLPDGTESQVTIIPFYDRTGLIYETLGTLNTALYEEILVTIIVIIVLLRQIRGSLLVSGLLPLAVLMCFIAMKLFHVDANIVALSGIAIAIGTMVDMGIVICENINRHLDLDEPGKSAPQKIYDAASEVASAVLTAIATTIVGFLPVFWMSGAEGKLFKPLAFTKTFALLASVLIAVILIPPVAKTLYRNPKKISLSNNSDAGLSAWIINVLLAALVAFSLARYWLPLGPDKGLILNYLFIVILFGSILAIVFLIYHYYTRMLTWCLAHKLVFLIIPLTCVICGGLIWHDMGKEFMPALDEGSFLFMPSTMPHASIGETLDVLSRLDRAIKTVPEVEDAVGKIGRVESPLDPAPISMVETVINYKSKYKTNQNGRYVLDENGKVIRQWREGIETPDDIWNEIIKVTRLPGATSAPKLQPIQTRLIMLQTGMRAPMGIKIKGPDLEIIEKVTLEFEKYLKEVNSVKASTVFADRIVGKPYFEIHIDREAIARYGIQLADAQNIIEIALGGKPVTTTVQGRQRYPVRIRYLRELRNDLETIDKILIPAPDGTQIPLTQLAEILYRKGPQVIKSEDTFLVGYVIFDAREGFAEVDVVNDCQKYIKDKIASKELDLQGTTYKFTGNYENQLRAQHTLIVVVPIALFVIFILLYLQFKAVLTSLMVFVGIFVAWSGGFIWLWLYSQPWFGDVSLIGLNLRELFNIHPYNLSVAVWVGFLALFGIASDDGVIFATYLNQRFEQDKPDTITDIRKATIEAARRRVRPALMTSATTILALIPVLTSTGKGSDIMVPMAIPSFGGMIFAGITIFLVPVLYCALKESSLKSKI
ncbi:MAG: efflux RND transporter permease subunit [Sedimentisphaerales bacterium]|nr:efflux RND transporter permease subunit [Sedimentisphaerales bacterium]